MSEEAPNAEYLMGVLINKMEVMDSNLNILKAENEALKKMINNPQALLRKMGLVSVSTPLTTDLLADPFRGDFEDTAILKTDSSYIPQSNEEFHNMSWEDIHDLANQAKGAVTE